MSAPFSSTLRIGPFSREVGVSVAALRAWERRYGLFAPQRTAGGYRLYGSEDARRARRMLACLERGIAAAESARIVLGELPVGDGPLHELAAGWEALDLARTHDALDALLAGPDPGRVVSVSILPLLARVCDALGCEPAGLARGHFASRTLEARLLALADGWHEGSGPLAVLGCPPGEQHTLGAITCGLALHRRGWRIAYLGPDTPLAAFESTAHALGARRVLVSVGVDGRLEPYADDVRALARRIPLVLAGAGVGTSLAELWIPGSPHEVALAVAQ
jgi:MerR family transcriptional regulator, light-induced transcriptional regulator